MDVLILQGCVYVKCSSKEAAGKVRQALHGWWFDGMLILKVSLAITPMNIFHAVSIQASARLTGPNLWVYVCVNILLFLLRLMICK